MAKKERKGKKEAEREETVKDLDVPEEESKAVKAGAFKVGNVPGNINVPSKLGNIPQK